MSQSHYQVLGVAATAPLADIKRAYRQLALRYHPDRHGGDQRHAAKFQAVAAAYAVLSDVGRRATYDHQLLLAARAADEQRRRQATRPATQHVYGVPMPPPAPLRTRTPAGRRERHYQSIPRQKMRFTRRDWLLTLLILGGIGLFVLAVTVTMNRVSANAAYERGLRAYVAGQWATATSYFDEALHFRPGYGPALRRRAELEMLGDHNAAAALADFKAALEDPAPPAVAADMHYRLGRCQVLVKQPEAAEQSFSRALALDSALAPAWLARAEVRLLDLQQPRPALADLRRGLARARGGPRYTQLRGLALTALGHYDEALAAYRQVLAARPRSGQIRYLLGRLEEQRGNRAAACDWYRQGYDLGHAPAGQSWRQLCRWVGILK